MGKLYKVEFEDFGWDELLGIFELLTKEIDNAIERAKKIEDRFIREQVVRTYDMAKNRVNRYKHEIERQLTEQGYKPPEHIS